MKYATSIAAILCIFTLSGCASVTTSALQPVAVSSETKQGVKVTQAQCTLKNTNGEWAVVTPNTVKVRRAAGNLAVKCKKPGLPDGNVRAISRAGAGMYGNIIIGGGIGALIDHSSGKAYNYPDKIKVIMGDTVNIDRHDPDAVNKTVVQKDKRTGAAAGSDEY